MVICHLLNMGEHVTQIIKRKDGYWIVELPYNTPDCGPYDKLKGDESATEDLRGLEHFFLFEYQHKKKIMVRTKRLN